MSNPFQFGRLPPVPPANSGNLIPFGGTAGAITITWNFSCGHQFIQKQVLTPWSGSNLLRTSHAKCPECIEAELDRHKEERDAARAKEEEARKAEEETLRKAQEKQEREAKAKRHDEQAMNVYKKQVAYFQLQIDNAGDNLPLRESQEKMLRTCRLLWADIVRKIEISEKEMAPAEEMSKTLLLERLEKVNLLASRAEILHQQEHKYKNPKKEILAGSLKEWKDISALMREAVEEYDSKVSPYVTAVENLQKTSNKAWKDAVKLMKEV